MIETHRPPVILANAKSGLSAFFFIARLRAAYFSFYTRRLSNEVWLATARECTARFMRSSFNVPSISSIFHHRVPRKPPFFCGTRDNYSRNLPAILSRVPRLGPKEIGIFELFPPPASSRKSRLRPFEVRGIIIRKFRQPFRRTFGRCNLNFPPFLVVVDDPS